ncbi:Actin-46, partial [Frankliniella fusca]
MSKGIKNFYGNGNDSSSDDDYLRPNSGIVIPPSPQRDSESDMDCSSDEDLLSLRHKLQKKTINNDYDKENVKTVDSFSSEDEKPLALTKAPLKDIKNKQNIKTNEEASLKTSRTLGVKRRLPLTIIQGVKPKPVKTVSFLTSPAPSSTSVQPLKQLQSETGKKQNLLGSSI